MWVLTGGVWRDHGFAATLTKPVAQLSGVVGPVGDQFARRGHAAQQSSGAYEVVGLAGGQGERDRSAARIAQGMNFGRPSAARSTDGVFELPPFAPAAERCALTWVESIDAQSRVLLTTPLRPLRA